MLKINLILVLLISFAVSLYAQENDETPVISPVVNKKLTTNNKLDYHLSAGTSFIYSKGFGSGSATYLAPELTYKFTPKIRLNAGIMFLNSNLLYNPYISLANEQSVVVKTKPSISTLAYISGDYLINDRLTISGMLMKDLSGSQNFGSYNPSIQAMSIHMNYKLSDNITIGAGMHMSQGNNWRYPSSGYGFYPSNQFGPFSDY